MAAGPTSSQLTLREVLKISALRRLWTAQLVNVFGDFLAIYAHSASFRSECIFRNGHSMQIISPAISGLLVSAFRANVCFWLDSASFLFQQSCFQRSP
jgi:hypothetical protein